MNYISQIAAWKLQHEQLLDMICKEIDESVEGSSKTEHSQQITFGLGTNVIKLPCTTPFMLAAEAFISTLTSATNDKILKMYIIGKTPDALDYLNELPEITDEIADILGRDID